MAMLGDWTKFCRPPADMSACPPDPVMFKGGAWTPELPLPGPVVAIPAPLAVRLPPCIQLPSANTNYLIKKKFKVFRVSFINNN